MGSSHLAISDRLASRDVAGSSASTNRFLLSSDSRNRVIGEFIFLGELRRCHLYRAIASNGEMHGRRIAVSKAAKPQPHRRTRPRPRTRTRKRVGCVCGFELLIDCKTMRFSPVDNPSRLRARENPRLRTLADARDGILLPPGRRAQRPTICCLHNADPKR